MSNRCPTVWHQSLGRFEIMRMSWRGIIFIRQHRLSLPYFLRGTILPQAVFLLSLMNNWLVYNWEKLRITSESICACWTEGWTNSVRHGRCQGLVSGDMSVTAQRFRWDSLNAGIMKFPHFFRLQLCYICGTYFSKVNLQFLSSDHNNPSKNIHNMLTAYFERPSWSIQTRHIEWCLGNKILLTGTCSGFKLDLNVKNTRRQVTSDYFLRNFYCFPMYF